MTQYAIFASSAGPITISTDGSRLTGLHLPGDRYFTAIPPGWVEAPEQPLLAQARAELLEYFAGQRRHFDVPLAAAGTPFQERVWAEIARIPAGATATYAEIAQAIGRPTAARAVGTAVGRNPICIVVPCHRVVPSGGGLGGYVAGLEFKRRLLSLEGAQV